MILRTCTHVATWGGLRRHYVITDDVETMFQYCDALRKEGRTHVRGIKLQTGFTLEHFTPDGQKDFPVVMEESAEYPTERPKSQQEQTVH